MCLRGVERRHDVEKSGVATRINKLEKTSEVWERLAKVWGRLEKCGDGYRVSGYRVIGLSGYRVIGYRVIGVSG